MNRFELALANAEKAIIIKRTQKSFWEHPNMIVDDEALYQSRGALLREAVRVLRSVPPSSKPRAQAVELQGYIPSDVPLHVFMSILKDTLNRFDAGALTHRQAQALVLMQEAEELGYTPSSYIAEKLGIHRQSAWEMVKRLSSKILTSTPRHDIMDVKQVVIGLDRVCCVPSCNEVTPRGDKPFCMEHYHDYKGSLSSHVQRWIDESGKRQFYRAREILKAS